MAELFFLIHTMISDPLSIHLNCEVLRILTEGGKKNKILTAELKLQIQTSIVGSKIHLPLPLHVKGLSNLYNLSLFISTIFDFGTLFISKLVI